MKSPNPDSSAVLNSHSEQVPQGTPLTYKKDELVSATFILQLVIALVVMLVALKLFARYFLSRSGHTVQGEEQRDELSIRSSVKLSVRTRLHHVKVGRNEFLVTETANQVHVHAIREHAVPATELEQKNLEKGDQ